MSAYVTVHISGKRTERYLESMRNASVMIYGLHRISDTTVALTVSAKDFKRLHRIPGGHDCRVRIVRRIGSAFIFQRWAKRYTLWSSVLCVLVLLLFASTRILFIDVDGCTRIAEQTVLRALSEQGLAVGASRRGWNFPALNNSIRAYDERIAWIGLSLDGSILHVTVVESIPTSDEENADIPSDIVAHKSGRITRIEADAGRAAVAVGDRVLAGDLLISGDLTREDSQYPVQTHAAGRIFAEIAYVAEAVGEAEAIELTDSGKAVPYREVRIAGQRLFTTAIPYANYVLRNCTSEKITDILLPLEVIEGTCFEQTQQTVQRDREETVENALCEAEKLAYLKIPKDAAILEKRAAWIESDGEIIGIVTILTEESIGLTREIEIGTNRYQGESNH